MTQPRPEIVSYANALLEAMDGALSQSPNTVILGQGADDHKGIFGSTTGLATKYGADRVSDMPLMEDGMTGIAVGLALNGVYPILTHIRSDFVLLSANQIINLIAKYKYMFGGLFEVPMLIRTVVGRSWGQGAQHSQSLQSLFAHIPGLTVVAPSSAETILDTYPYLIAKHRAPVISFEHRMLYNLDFEVDRSAAPANPLTPRVVRQGRDLTIVATSIMVLEARRAARWLADHADIQAEVIDLHCLSAIDPAVLMTSLGKTGRLLVCDTSWPGFGTAAEVCRLVVEQDPGVLKQPVRSLGMAPAPCPTAKALEDLYYPNLATVVDAAAALVRGRVDHGVPLPAEKTMSDIYKKFRGPF
ncbi:MAG: transketolase C-terminal domain-containing protein [Alphaproteobacteria bacterium]|nr:transketolase C-terminal domain-containing protein [Alphaproteobacteria bacterium]